ncbi:anthranilate synthase component I family protein [Flagellimonas zhangzhouensis]|uniref:Para-aminobenzoate synthetase component 1 n=1 Tax=Flagellimonas zhangzhouensis TaxID=1073328 RepID=A0A1H2S8K7_9FLAO|nr:anthranilate synthase component I family protein [Allomuricauda zhangzhouensis]SDQ72048.1 para-aminobenzoate synthetase component 1 [Allomuricauda zhangzhouensis]SDW28002.1 para-aminobenzoate synthetase component 1 [Allomuricauda zhangzhouensis]
MRHHQTFPFESLSQTKASLLEWSKGFEDVVWLDSNSHQDQYSSFEACLAVGAYFTIDALDVLHEFVGQQKDWLFGYFTYDVKNQIEDLTSGNADFLEFPELHFFQPRKIILVKEGQLHFHYLDGYANEVVSDYKAIFNTKPIQKLALNEFGPIKIKSRLTEEDYLEKANQFLEHIHRGDIYEANFCQEFYAEEANLDPLEKFQQLNEISEPPFATFLRMKEHYVLCASPERYLKKAGQKVISQPIKGTAPRGINTVEDKKISEHLTNDPKERSENIMITDLVRNDLSKSALKGSVEVEELCKPYVFKQVHQLISTVVSKVENHKNSLELILETFPMGSMTGAPKISAMKIIEELEETKRGMYSGAVGYFDPDGDFDFNVVIRSILYNASKKYISFSVGGAITAKSNPEKEFQECLLKAKAMREVLEKGQ